MNWKEGKCVYELEGREGYIYELEGRERYLYELEEREGYIYELEGSEGQHRRKGRVDQKEEMVYI